jgi:hypothetical protein
MMIHERQGATRGICMVYRSIPSDGRLFLDTSILSAGSGLEMWTLYQQLESTSRRPSAQKYSGIYNITEANNVIHSQMYSPPRRSPGKWGLSQHQYFVSCVSGEKWAGMR